MVKVVCRGGGSFLVSGLKSGDAHGKKKRILGLLCIYGESCLFRVIQRGKNQRRGRGRQYRRKLATSRGSLASKNKNGARDRRG